MECRFLFIPNYFSKNCGFFSEFKIGNLLNIFLILFFCGIKCNILNAKHYDTLNVTIYQSSQDFYHNRSQSVDAIVLTKEISDHYFYANKIIDRKNGKKLNEYKFIWAIKYNDGIYVNMGYMDLISSVNMYIKLDIVGTYCALVYDERMPYQNKNSLSNGGGIVGVWNAPASEILRAKDHWKVEDKKSVPIIVFNLLDNEYRNFSLSRNESCLLTFISRKKLKKLIELYPDNIVRVEPTADDLLKYIERINSKIGSKNN